MKKFLVLLAIIPAFLRVNADLLPGFEHHEDVLPPIVDRFESPRNVTEGDGVAARPDNPADRINGRAIERAVDRLMEIPVTAGVSTGANYKDYKESPAPAHCVGFCYPSFYTEYDYIRTNDDRPTGPDGDTHSGLVGFDFSTYGDVLVGAIYSVSRQNLNSDAGNFGTDSDSNFVSLYAAKSFAGWLNVGVSGGWGNTANDTTLLNPPDSSGNDTDTWSVSPFIGIFHKWGAFSFSTTATYFWQDVDGDDSGKFGVDLTLKYALTEQLSIAGLAKYKQMVDYDKSVSDDRNWLTVGGKIAYRPTHAWEIWGGYEYETLNDNYHDHTVRSGVTYSF
jgi:hypothetical protein